MNGGQQRHRSNSCNEQGRFVRLESRTGQLEATIHDARESFASERGLAQALRTTQKAWNLRTDGCMDSVKKRVGKLETQAGVNTAKLAIILSVVMLAVTLISNHLLK